MTATRPSALRAEARVLAFAGMVTLAVSFPPTMSAALSALFTQGPLPWSALSLGGVALVSGYVACHLASGRLMLARVRDG
ncbi:MAG: hypothetical protein K2P58_15550 [Hyphomonadaceae bacterium]|nr:hypothetical protein [Hyphomonadaceae bacterium]